jgi:hypothetical protein
MRIDPRNVARNGWFVAAFVISGVAIGLLLASPSWLSTSCSASRSDCVSTFFVAFLAFIGSLSCTLWGFVYRSRMRAWERNEPWLRRPRSGSPPALEHRDR